MESLSSTKSESWLSWFLRGILILLFLILFAKLIEVQVIKGNYYRNLSENNRIRRVVIPASRGKILAKGGEVIAGNIEIKKRIIFTNSGFTLSEDLTNVTSEEKVTDYKRYYPMDGKFSHALGYLAQVGGNEVGKINPDCPEKGPRLIDSLVGKTGLEEEYECLLSGFPGEEIIEVNATGNEIRILGRREPTPGQDLQTTIDFGLQTTVANEMKGKKGAVIVTDTEGHILAFYSYPTFNPNIFVNKGNSEEISSLLNDQNLPFFNRATGGTFHPGSVFKPVTAIAALEEGMIDKNFTYNDQGVITVGDYSYANWFFTEYGRTEGPVNLVKAIARSTDTFFYTIGQMVGPDAIAKWAGTFGLDKLTGIDISGEVKGLIPTPEWKEEVKKESWFLGNTYHMSIGQGDVSVTPTEINTYISAISSKGMLCSPRFNMQKSLICKKVKVSQNTLNIVRDGMDSACTSGGTGSTFFDFSQKHGGMVVACKTGTAEVSTDGIPHAWFTFFAPSDKPQIVATVLIERGGQGSSVAGPIARKIADYYFTSFAN
jgi:penicillin-binding protein 2